MAQSDQVSPSPDGGWRGKGPVQSSATTRWINRALFGAITLVLVGFLVWLIWLWYSPRQTHLVCLSVVQYNRLTVPAVPFGEEDVEQLAKLPLGTPVTRLDDVTAIDGALAGIDTGRRDVLICYISAHGVSEDGKAFLLGDAYDARSKEERYELGELLGRLQRSRAKHKLLILNVGHVGCDPRLGMAANEFPRILEQQLTELDDRRLWVLTSNRSLQTSHASFSAGRSIFGYYVTEGLRGAADRAGNDDGNVGLAELTRYVCDGVERWMRRDVGGRQAQTPWLLQGSEGTVTQPPDHVLVRAAAEEPPEETGAGDGQEKPGSPPRAPPLPEELVQLIWRFPEEIRLQMQRRNSGEDDSWMPVDYAPHLWRKYLDLLLHYESRYRSGKGLDKDGLRAELQLVLADHDAEFWQQQNVARVDFRGTPQDKKTTAKIRKLIQLKNELVFAAPCYVRWYARISQASTGRQTHPHYDAFEDLSDLLGELGRFTDDLEALAVAAAGGESRSRVDDVLKRLDDGNRKLEGLDAALKERLDREVAEMAAKPGKNGTFAAEHSGRACRIEALLGLPLLASGQRIALLGALGALASNPPKTPALTDDGPNHLDLKELDEEAEQFADWQRELLVRQATLQRQLVLLADPNETIDSAPAGAGRDRAGKEKFWTACRRFGKDLGDFYRGLPKEIRDAKADGDLLRAERLLRLVDPRDAEEHDEATTGWFIVRDVRLPPPAGRPALTAAAQTETPRLGADGQPGGFQIRIVAPGLSAREAEVTLDYDPDLLRVSTADGRAEIKPGQPHKIGLRENETVREYAVIALADNRTTKPPEVNFTVRAGGATAPGKVAFELPAPEVVALHVYRVDGPRDVLMTGADPIRLQPFPDRDSEFRFDLQNLSEKTKEVAVQLLRVSTRRRSRLPSPDRLVKRAGQWQPGVEELTAPKEMTLPQKSDPKAVPFAAAQPAAPTETPAETEEAPEPAWDPCVWACVIHDKNDTASAAPKWVYWLDFLPVDPRQYVRLESLPSYDPRQRAVNVHVEVRKTDGRGKPNPSLPKISPESPIRISWDTGSEVGIKTVRSKMLITSPDRSAQWPIAVDPRGPGEVLLRLHVDGYPRVFAYRIEREQHGRVSEINRADVRITAPGAGEAYRTAGPIPLAFQVDDPRNLFAPWGGTVAHGTGLRGLIRVRLASDATGVAPVEIEPFSGNRQMNLSRPEISPTGIVRIRGGVRDFRIDLQDDRLDDGRVRLEVELELPESATRAGGDWPKDAVEILLDSKEPVCEGAVRSRRVRPGEPFVLEVTIKDLSGVEKIEVGVDADGSGELEDAEKHIPLPRPDAEGKCQVRLSTEKLNPGIYDVLLRATDRAGNGPARALFKGVEVVAPATAAPVARPGLGAIEGRVVSPQGDPRPGITVTLKPPGRTAATGADGRFSFKDLKPGEYTLLAEGFVKGYKRSAEETAVVTAKAEATTVAIVLSQN